MQLRHVRMTIRRMMAVVAVAAFLMGLVRLVWRFGYAERVYEPSAAFRLVTSCPVHRVPLSTAIEPMLNGDASYTLEYYEASKREFPWSYSRVYSMRGDAYGFWRARFCQSCRKAEAEWKPAWMRDKERGDGSTIRN
jgi:hypothetical protein